MGKKVTGFHEPDLDLDGTRYAHPEGFINANRGVNNANLGLRDTLERAAERHVQANRRSRRATHYPSHVIDSTCDPFTLSCLLCGEARIPIHARFCPGCSVKLKLPGADNGADEVVNVSIRAMPVPGTTPGETTRSRTAVPNELRAYLLQQRAPLVYQDIGGGGGTGPTAAPAATVSSPSAKRSGENVVKDLLCTTSAPGGGQPPGGGGLTTLDVKKDKKSKKSKKDKKERKDSDKKKKKKKEHNRHNSGLSSFNV